mgnify:FL=1
MTKKGFTIVPNQVIWDDDLCNDSKQLFTYIRSLSEKYRTLRNSTIKAKLGISLNTLQKCKKELVKNGYLIVHRRTSANLYELKVPKKSVLPLSNGGYVTNQNLGSIKKDKTNSYNTNKGFKKLKKFDE